MANSAALDLDVHCLQRQDISGISRTRANLIKGEYLAIIQGQFFLFLQKNMLL